MRPSTCVVTLLSFLGVLGAPSAQLDYRSAIDSSATMSNGQKTLTFADAVAKGMERFKTADAKVAKRVDKVGGDTLLQAHFKEEPVASTQTARQPVADYRQSLKSFLGVDVDTKTFYKVELSSGGTTLLASYSPQTGVITADDVKKLPQDLQVSEALYWEYQKVATTHNIKSAAKIKGIVQRNVTNKDTLAIITAVFEKNNKDHRKEIELIVTAGLAEYYALIGTPNGAAAAYMLGDHPVAIGKGHIGSIMIIGGFAPKLIIRYV